MVRSPGIYYGKETDIKTDLPILSAQLIPYRGAWLEYAGSGMDHGVRQGALAGPGPQRQLLVELIAAHGAQVVPPGSKSGCASPSSRSCWSSTRATS